MPGSYALDVNGDMQVSDGYGVLTFTHDNLNNSVTTISNTTSYPDSNATLQVTGGFFSARGTFTASASATTIALLKVGMFMVSAQSSTGTVYDSCVGYAYTTSNANKVSSNSNTAIIAFNTSNIQISNASSNLNWVVTYFPSP
jgi:hypothetical protein